MFALILLFLIFFISDILRFFSFIIFFLFKAIFSHSSMVHQLAENFLIFPLSESILIHASFLKDVLAWLGFWDDSSFLSVIRGGLITCPGLHTSHPEICCHLDHFFPNRENFISSKTFHCL